MITDDFLTNRCYGFPVRGGERRVKPQVLAAVHITANMGSAKNQRDYANRPYVPGDDHPTAHYYIDRDGDGVHAVNEIKYAAWSNGDLKAPKTSNAGVEYLVKLRAGGKNANEGCYLEIECVGTATSSGQWTDAQFTTVAGLISEAATATGLPINADTVLPHAYINTIDRSHCPALNVAAHMTRLINLAQVHVPPEEVMFPTRFPGGGRYGQVAVDAGKTVYKKGDGSAVVVGSSGSGGWGASAVHDVAGGSAGFNYTSDSTGTELWVDADDATFTEDVTAADCTAEVKAEHDKVKAAAVAAAEAIP